MKRSTSHSKRRCTIATVVRNGGDGVTETE